MSGPRALLRPLLSAALPPAALLLALSPPLGAQTAAGIDTTPPSSWRFELSADGTWYENAYFLGPALADTSWSTNGRATLTRQKRFKTGSFSLSGFGGAIYYPEIDDLNQPTYGGTFGLDWQAGRRTKLKLGQDYQRTNTRYLSGVDAEGLPLPTSGIEFATSTLGWEQQLSQRWQLGIDGSFEARRFDEDALADGEQVYATARVGYQVGRQTTLFLGYGYTSAWLEDQTTRSHQALFGARKVVDRGVGYELGGGVGYVDSTGEIYPAGRAGLTATGRSARLALLYYRDFGQAYGYGREMIGDLASLTLTWTPNRKLSFDAGYNFGYRRDPADETYTILSGVASAGFRWTIGGGLGFGASYVWERNETEGLPVVEGGRVTASLSYGVDWK